MSCHVREISIGLLVSFAFAFQAAADEAPTGDGKLIVTISSEPNKTYLSYTLEFRKRDRSEHLNLANNAYNWLMPDKNDFSDTDENGTVKIATLKPGEWELYEYFVTTRAGGAIILSGNHGMLDPGPDFSIPFTITPGRATYIGDFKAIGSTTKSLLGLEVPWDVHYVVADHSARDIAIARSKDANLGEIDIRIPDIDAMKNPNFEMDRAEAPTPASQTTPGK